jgi:prepilin-type N-terminal cleavage/methylation domain-containing protein/prepilin-type processing-associated H-X9-DG protein
MKLVTSCRVPSRPRGQRGGFTLVELLVVIAIIGILVGLLLPAVQKVRESANRVRCGNNMHQLAIGVLHFHDANGTFPPDTHYTYDPTAPNWSWLVFVMPFVEQRDLYIATGVTAKPPSNINQSLPVIARQVKNFLCPSDPDAWGAPQSHASNYDMVDPVLGPLTYGVTSYRGNIGSNWGGGAPSSPQWWGTDPQWCNPDPNNTDPTTTYDGCLYGNGVLFETVNPIRIANVTDGTSFTILLGEGLTGKDNMNAWCHMDNAIATCAYPPNAKRADGQDYPPGDWFNRFAFTSAHPKGVQFAMVDGSVRFIKDTVALDLFRALGTRAQGEVTETP